MFEWSFLLIIGIIFIIAGSLAIVLHIVRSEKHGEADEEKPQYTKNESAEKVQGGGVILIGPIPIVFGTDKRYAILLILLSIALMLLALIFTSRFRG